MSQIHIDNTTNNTTMTVQRINRSQGSLQNKTQIQTWDNMFKNFYHFFQKKQKKTPYLIQSNTVTKVEQTPIETITPLPQFNQFKENLKLRYNFKQYIAGNQSAEQLLQQCNKIKSVKKPKSINKNNPSKPNFRFFNLLGINEEQFASKVRAQKRLDKIRNLVKEKINEKEKQNIQENYQDCGFIKYALHLCENYEDRIKEGALNGPKISGKYQRFQGGVRWNDNNNKKKLTQSCKQLKSETRIQKFETQGEVYQHATEYLNEQLSNQYLQDQKQKRQVKLSILHNRKQQFQKLFKEHNNKFYEFNNGAQKEPSLKDIELYIYLHKANRMNNSLKDSQTTKQKIKHNHKKNQTQLTEDYNSHDSSLCSELETKLDYLYHASQKAQERVKEDNKQNLFKYIKNIQKVEQLRKEIQTVNLEKLYFQKRVQ